MSSEMLVAGGLGLKAKTCTKARMEDEILIYQSEDGLTHIDVRMEDETV